MHKLFAKYILISLALTLLITLPIQAQLSEKLSRANTLLQGGVFSGDEAKSLLDDILKEAPNNSTALNLRGIFYSQQYNLKLGEADFDKAIKQEQKWYYIYNKAFNQLLQTNYSGAITSLNQAERLNSKQPLIPALRSEVYRLQNKEAAAKADYDKALKINKEFHSLYAQIATDYYYSAKYTEAESFINKAISISKQPYYYFLKGMIATAVGSYNNAIEVFTEGININSKLPLPYIGRGVANMLKKDFKAANSDFDQAIANGLNDRGNVFKGIALYMDGDYAAAKTALEEAIKLNTKNPKAYSFYGKILARSGNDSADGYYNKAIQLNPSDPSLRFDYGMYLSGKKEFNQALTQFTLAVARDAKNETYLWGRSIANYGLKSYKAALQDLNGSLAINPKFGKALHKRADVYYALGQDKMALADANAACKLGEVTACP